MKTLPVILFILSAFILHADDALPFGVIYSTAIPDPTKGSYPSAIATDAAGNTYLAGSTTDALLPATPGALQPYLAQGNCPYGNGLNSAPCADAVIAKLDPSGRVVRLTYFGGSGAESVSAITVDASGNVWIAGTTSSSDLPVTPNAAQKTLGGPSDAFVAEIDPTGTRLLYSSYLGGPGTDVAEGIAVAGAGNSALVYVAGRTDGDFPVTAGALDVATGGCFIKALRPGGSIQASALFAGQCAGVAADSNGSVYVSGTALGDVVPVTPGAWQTTYGGGAYDAFIAKLDGGLSRVIWATWVGGSGHDLGGGIQLDSGGNVWMAGITGSPDFPVTAGALYSTPAATLPDDHFTGYIVRIAPDGSRALVSEFLPGQISGFTLDSGGNLLASLSSASYYPFAATPGSTWPCFQDPDHQASGDLDSGLLKLDSGGTRLLWSTWSGASLLAGPVAADAGGNAVTAGQSFSPGTIVIANVSTQPGPPRLVASCVVQSAPPYSSQLAPGLIFSIWGAGFGPAQGAVAQLNADGKIGTELGGVQVLIEDMPAPLLYVSAQQINLVAPYMLNGRVAAHIHIVTANGTSNEVVLPVAAAAPEVFEDVFSGTPYAAILNQDGTVNSPNNPAHAGDIVAMFVSGAGQMMPAGQDGDVPLTGERKPVLPVAVQIANSGGYPLVPAEITYAGEAPGLVSGALQVNFQIPDLYIGPYAPYGRGVLKVGDWISSEFLIALHS
jgi:uncharacterized protein (TIGR03437 family)